MQFEASQFMHPELANEWEMLESSAYSNPYANPYAPEASMETMETMETMEVEGELEALPFFNGEDEGEAAAEWEGLGEDESDQFLPFLIPLAAKALPLLAKVGAPLLKTAAKKLLPKAGNLAMRVARNMLRPRPGRGGFRPSSGQIRRPIRRRRPPKPARPAIRTRPSATMRPNRPYSGQPMSRPTDTPSGMPTAPGMSSPTAAWGGMGGWANVPSGAMPSRDQQIAILFRQLSDIFARGEQEASHLEAQLFGANEFEGELAAHEAAHEAALTEVMAAEAAHALNESEAEAILGATLPITIRIMGGQTTLRPILPTLIQANARLVNSLHQDGSAGRQLLRTVPAIQRRTVRSLQALRRRGQPITPGLATATMAGQAARVLSNPAVCGRTLVRNAVIRQSTVAPARATAIPIRR